MAQKITKNYTQIFQGLALTVTILSLSACQTADTGGDASTTDAGNTDNADNVSDTSSNGEGLKIGTLFPITGDLASIGQNMPVAVQLAVDTINACNGVNESPVTLVNEDSQTDPSAGVTAMTKLAEVDRVAGVAGAFASSVSGAAVDVAVRNKIMLISPGSTSPVFTDRAQNGEFEGYWARTAPPDTYQAQALAALAQKEGFENVSTVVINNDYGVGFEQQFVQAFEKSGGKIADKNSPVRYDPKAPTLDSEAKAAFGSKPDAVAAVLYAETGSVLLKSAFEQGLTEGVTILLTDGVYSEDFITQVGKTGDGKSIIAGALGTVPGANGQALADFTNLWKENIQKEVSAFVPHSWDAAILMMLAAEAADANTGEGIQSQIREVANAPGTEVTDPCEAMELVRNGEDINYQGASGNVDIDENGDVIGGYDVWQVNEDGTLEVVDNVTPTN
ncbi:ABC-type branched-chain amino acid transport system, periplasmic component [Hyella patelloides LEGE 07179]|uniref:ABC-type branched-chain amino acid transport system, periplasmic component n=1 Tax=Hyella patelloides LEGE 07179 TaxID=945734 RepID=A0A563VKH4_9CYAN|nr:ABC transporter substrate-binding protein [Hyella patelloides]VEP11833.1 ABC-type branched-chain amino acid transport system, periplasmic component [Hyella patelloides LEGE 07179]